ncbi:DUF5681 domain-containing protein [Sphingomonas sp. IC-11]|uniref:DUF5681 domain-containing protein n=1 Tax=Sphingomonas sp. IC-11 TaxID=2898528 RepID=UPI001E296AA8|nr:DUF5681 domain-containing protein [Sphingomonas sp. IC-11]MCD2317269.1 DUF5681 domain-containing protein [Sphingomonas sp. IC-11]
MADRSYEVGYGKPPTQHRFKRGQSGNPRGRPKGARGFKTLVEEMLSELVTVNVAGRKRKVSVVVAALKRLAQKAVNDGDPRALDRLLGLAQLADAGRPADAPEPTADDLAVFEQLKRDLMGDQHD